MRHLITGGSGFVGITIGRLLRARGEDVRVLDVWQSDELADGAEFVQGDVTDRASMRAAMEGVDYVHHTAALVPLAKAGSRYRDVNVGGTRIALETAKDAGVKFFAHMSSSAVFGSPDVMPITNDTPRRPVEIYGEAKKQAEDIVLEAMNAGVPAAVIRPRTIIGKGRLGIFQILFDWIRDGANPFIIGKGDQLFQFVHADDLCTASIQACLLERPGAFNVGTDRSGTLRDDLTALCDHAGTGSRVRSLPVGPSIVLLTVLDKVGLSPLSPWHYKTYHKPFWFDSEPAFKALEYRPCFSNVETMTQAYDWFIREYRAAAQRSDASSHKSPVKQGVLALLKKLS
jgi:nucleoside-diphosphate-sugar epimerase